MLVCVHVVSYLTAIISCHDNWRRGNMAESAYIIGWLTLTLTLFANDPRP